MQGQLTDILDFLHQHGILGWFHYKFIEASSKMALFVPLGIVSALAFPEKRWWQVRGFPAVWNWASSCFFTTALQALWTS
jgi:hypothetical protein